MTGSLHSLTRLHIIQSETQTLTRGSLLSICQKFSRYTCQCNFRKVRPSWSRFSSWTALCETCCTKFHQNRAVGMGSVGINSLSTQNKVCFFTAPVFWGNSRKLYRQLLHQIISKYDGTCRQQGGHPSHVCGHVWLSSNRLWRESAALGGRSCMSNFTKPVNTNAKSWRTISAILTFMINRCCFVKNAYNKLHEYPRKGLVGDCRTTSQPTDWRQASSAYCVRNVHNRAAGLGA